MTEQYLLNRDDLRQLTGYKRAGKQRTWLQEKRIPFVEDHRGFPVVRAADVNAHYERMDRGMAF
jgi:hypothetical protein